MIVGIVLVIVCPIVGIVLTTYALKWGNIAHLIRDVPTTPVGQISEGLTEVKGAVSALSEELISPMTRTHCVYFRFVVKEKKSSGKNSYWKTIIDDQQYATCLIEDDTGGCEVDIAASKLLLAVDYHCRSGTFNDAPSQLEETLAEYGRTSQGIVFNKAMRYEETVLEVGDNMYVLGEVVPREGEFPLITKVDTEFIVSDKSERELLTSYSLYATVCWAGMVVCGAGTGVGLFLLAINLL
ncbi:MAG: hypothetical protein HN348_04365 [Proteobacteria bacterium]|jgi:hypothetical protein|nr:hypothetical protein [Pseudomonadota bacterium]